VELWQRLLAALRLQPGSPRRTFELDKSLQTALLQRAGQEQRPVEQIQAELIAAGLDQLRSSDGLKQRWGILSAREQQVTALTCLGYTNRQMAARLGVSPETVKGYVRQALAKFHLHSKDELRLQLGQWDFSEWAPPAQL
jgi:DNA-binding CsgD family transcriptional regulator